MSALFWAIATLAIALVALFVYCAWWVITDLREEAQVRQREALRAEQRAARLAQLRAIGRPE